MSKSVKTILASLLFLITTSVANASALTECDLQQFPTKYELAIRQFAKTAPKNANEALIAINKAKSDFDLAVKNCVAAKNIQFDQLSDAFDYQFLLAIMVDLKADTDGKISIESCKDAQSLVQQQGVFPHQEEIKNTSAETKVLSVLRRACRR